MDSPAAAPRPFVSVRALQAIVAKHINAAALKERTDVAELNANLQKELFDVHRCHDVSELRKRMQSHLHWYNHARTNHALGGLLVPADRYYGGAEEVLARIEAGALRESADALDLHERCLELFKVQSKGGVPEVWLLGRKLLELRPPDQK